MEQSLHLSSLRAYLAFPLREREAVNRFMVGAALYIAGSIIPIIPMIPALGYQYQVMQRVIAGQGPSMPAWEDWGRLFKDGLKLFLIGAVYLLPGSVFMFGGYAIYMIAVFGMMGAGRNPSNGQIFGFLGGMAALFIGMTLGMLLGLLGSLPLPMAAAHAVAQDRVSAAFQVGRWWPILRRSLGDFVVAWIVFYGLFALLYLIFALLYMTIILCLALPLALGALSFYMLLTGSAIFADIYRQSAAGAPAGEAPAPGVASPLPGRALEEAAPKPSEAAEDPHATRRLSGSEDLPLPNPPQP